MDTLFAAAQSPMKLVAAAAGVAALLALAFWALRGVRRGGLRGAGARARQPRLAVIDQAFIDNRRRLVLVRRDNVEHLLIIGGPSDVVVEQNIVRVAPAAREVVPMRPAAGDTLPRAVPLEEGTP